MIIKGTEQIVDRVGLNFTTHTPLSFPVDLDDLGRFELLFVELAGAVVESAVDEFLLLELCC